MIVHDIIIVVTHIVIDDCDVVPSLAFDLVNIRRTAVERIALAAIVSLCAEVAWDFLALLGSRLETLLRSKIESCRTPKLGRCLKSVWGS